MINQMIPEGWVFFSADMSMVNRTSGTPQKGFVMLRRIGEKFDKFFTLSENEQEKYHLYMTGRGWTVEGAVSDAVLNVGKLLEWEYPVNVTDVWMNHLGGGNFRADHKPTGFTGLGKSEDDAIDHLNRRLGNFIERVHVLNQKGEVE